ncbi:MAG: hypothetical protein NT159_02795 [Proteobacteria bacterium]|nr:hypothetical protein [Pseudomonadota bacterium]
MRKVTPVIPTESEKIWLRELIRRYQSGEPVDPWVMRIALRDKLPADFAPSRMNPLLAGTNAITLLGILAVDPGSELARDTERVILAIRDLLIKNPHVRNVTAAEIAQQLDLDSEYTEKLFGLMATVGSFWASASGTTTGRGGLSSINVDREECLTAFMAFRDIQTQVNQILAEREQAALSASNALQQTYNLAVLQANIPTTDNRPPEILQLKPSFYGVGIDLKALWRRLLALFAKR